MDIESLAEEVKRIAGAFQTIFSVKAPEPAPQPIILEPKAAPKLAPKPEQKPNGVEALEQVRRKLWAKVVEQIAEEFEPWDLKGRVLFFLEQCGPIEAHWLREAGVWEGLGQVVGYLEGLANEGLAFRLEKKWAITEAGKRLIEPEEEVVAPVPLPPAPYFQREAKPTYCVPVPEQPRLAVVPSIPKVPEPVTPIGMQRPQKAECLEAKQWLLILLRRAGECLRRSLKRRVFEDTEKTQRREMMWLQHATTRRKTG